MRRTVVNSSAPIVVMLHNVSISSAFIISMVINRNKIIEIMK
jgi:hypothetical protein